jgi:hypothetical protein
MTQRILGLLLLGLLGLTGCTHTENQVNTVRPTKPDDPEEVPAPISRLLPEEINSENYRAKIEQFEREMTRDGKKIRPEGLAEK